MGQQEAVPEPLHGHPRATALRSGQHLSPLRTCRKIALWRQTAHTPNLCKGAEMRSRMQLE
ncbi:hypothetical protein JZ751_027595 [Albula glossodonta]|uniref:Uncharacterized protein n=1 Tax=Albula glossodonta TaxID=121402 RepID=A0A8T2NBF2_9TELE|nr:hypothetical protein JZ751_027595 [Albula glossodonta]